MSAHAAYTVWDVTDQTVQDTGHVPPWLVTLGAVAYGGAPAPTQPVAIPAQATEASETSFEEFYTWSLMVKRLVIPPALSVPLVAKARAALLRLTERHGQLRDLLMAVVAEAYPDTVALHEEDGVPPCVASYTLVSLMNHPNRQDNFVALLRSRYQALRH